MVRALSAALLLAASSAYAAPEIPSFEASVANIQAVVAASRAASVKKLSADVGPQLDNLSWDLERADQDAQRLRNDLRWLLQRVRQHRSLAPGRPQPGRPAPQQPDNDPSLRWDVQRLTQDLSRLARDAQWRSTDLRNLSAQTGKDAALVGPASRVLDAARRLKGDTNWLATDARFAYFDFMRAGFTFEAMDLDRNTRDFDSRAQDLQNDADALLTKVRP